MVALAVLALLVLASAGVDGKRTSVLGPRMGPLFTVSGVSAGAFMAVQHHVAYSSSIDGVGIVAGGPYWCAMADIDVATTSCEYDPDRISLDLLYGATEYAYGLDSIDNPSFLVNAGVFLFSGKLDTVVDTGVVKKAESYYSHYIGSSRAASQIKTVYNFSAEHSFPTVEYGNACKFLGEPFINACGYDGAGDLLEHIYHVNGKTLVRPSSNTSNLKNLEKLETASYLPEVVPSPKDISLDTVAFAYVPTQCRTGSKSGCTLHVAYHGCKQTRKLIGMQFVEDAGYLPWAEANNIVVLFPIAVESDLPFNPEGCFDWWGYTGEEYATQLAPQLITVTNMVTHLAKLYT
jgi:hypothetical protein